MTVTKEEWVDLPEDSIRLNDITIAYQCRYQKKTSTLSPNIINYNMVCRFKDILPLYNKIDYKKNEIYMKPEDLKLLYCPFELIISPVGKAPPVEIYRKQYKKYVSTAKGMLDMGIDPDVGVDWKHFNKEEFATQVSFVDTNVNQRIRVLKHQPLVRKQYGDLSGKQLEEELIMQSAYWKMKKVIGISTLFKVNKKRTEIIDGPF